MRVSISRESQQILKNNHFFKISDGKNKSNTKCTATKLCDNQKAEQKDIVSTKKTIFRKSITLTSDKPSVASFKFNCPTGKSCAKMSSQHDLLTHLQKVHKTTVTQYYCSLKDKVTVKFSEKSIIALVIPKNGNLDMFLVVKVNNNDSNSEMVDSNELNCCWVWYVGNKTNANLYHINMEYNKIKWRGTSYSLETNMGDILKSNSYAVLDSNVTNLFIEIR